MANVRASGVRILTDPILEGSWERQVQRKTTGGISEVAPESSQEKDSNFVDNNVINDDPTLIPLHDLTGGLNVDGHVPGEPVMEGSGKKETGLVHSWRSREIDPVIVSDVGGGNGLIVSSSGGNNLVCGSQTTGVAREHLVLQQRSQTNIDSGKRIMRENRMALANEVDLQAHSRSGGYHAMDQEPPVAEITPENCPFFVHKFGSQENGGFIISDLVWGKVKSHPWWPGQIIDPSDASKLAVNCQKKDTLLVAYFWDKTFAWCEESQLKPFFPNFSAFEKQVSSDVFSRAIKSALKEVARRIDAGTMCSCLNDRSLFKVYPKMENAGVRQGFDYCTVNGREIVSSLNSRGLVGYIRELALDPTKGTTDKLLYVMFKYHTMAFRRWMAFMSDKRTELVTVPTGSVNLPKNGISHTDMPIPASPLMQINLSTPSTTPRVDSSNEKPKRKRGRPRKNLGEEEKVLSAKRRKVDSLETPSVKCPSGPGNVQESYWSEMSLRVQADGKRVVSAAKRPVIIPVVERKSDECIPTALLLSISNSCGKVPSDMEIVRIFSRYGPLKGEMEKEVKGRQSQVKLVFKKRADAEMAFGSLSKQHVFGSSLLKYRLVDLPSEVADSSEQEMVEVLNEEDHGLVDVRTEIPSKINPTTLLLIFSNKSAKLPSEMELVRMFSHHGPLKERGVEKEVEGTTYQFRIAFKKHSSAEMAFTCLSKQNLFGPSLLSYKLVSLPVEASKKSGQEKVEAPNKNEDSHMEVPALKENLVQLSRAPVDHRTERLIGLTSNGQTDAVTDISVDSSSITHGESAGEISAAPSSIVQCKNVNEVSIAPIITIVSATAVDSQSRKQGEDAVVMSFNPSSSVKGAGVTEMPINPPSTVRATELLVGSACPIKACEILANPSSTMQGDIPSEIPINSSSTRDGKAYVNAFGELLIVSSKTPGGAGGEGKTIDEVPAANLRTEDSEVGGRVRVLSSTGLEDALFEMCIDSSGTGENQEPSPKKLDNSNAQQRAMALENTRSATPKPISNGSMLLECTPSRSAILSCNTMAPIQKSSPIWQSLESLDLFTQTPQQPHFKKLDKYCQEMREGMAVGLMVTYTNLVNSTKNLSFDDDDVTVIGQKCSCLETLEENGFNVDPIRTRLNRLLRIKTDHAESRLKRAELEKELADKENESMNMLRKIKKIRSDVGKLDEQINALMEESHTLVVERDRLLELTVGNGHEISRLKNELSNVNRSQGSAREEFARVLVEPFGGGSS